MVELGVSVQVDLVRLAVRRQWWEIDAIPPDGRKHCCSVLVGCGDHRQYALGELVLERAVVVCVLIALCVCALVYRCEGVAYLFGVRGCLRIVLCSPKVYLHRSHASSAKRVRFCSALVVHP